jgi:hypothetical protein
MLSTSTVVNQDKVQNKRQQLPYSSHVQYTWTYKHPRYLSRTSHA